MRHLPLAALSFLLSPVHPGMRRATVNGGTAMIHRLLLVPILGLAITGCAESTGTETQRVNVDDVRIVKDADALKGCALIGGFHDGDYTKFRRLTAQQGGNVGLLTAKQVYVFPASIEPLVEVYRCPNSRE